jgi:hypothetical protein
MKPFDFGRLWRSKRALRERLAGRPIAEKLRLLDAMHESALSIRRANRRQVNVVREEPPDYGTKS